MTTKWYLYANDAQYQAIKDSLDAASFAYERTPSWMVLPAVQSPALVASTRDGITLLVEGEQVIKNFLFKKSETGKAYAALTDVIVDNALANLPRPVSPKQRDYFANVAAAITADARSSRRKARHA
jgi:hypothetical protein